MRVILSSQGEVASVNKMTVIWLGIMAVIGIVMIVMKLRNRNSNTGEK